MTRDEIWRCIADTAHRHGLDPDLCAAIASVESAGNAYAVRYEPEWKYFYSVSKSAKNLGITESTEQILQACSWGVLQIMGSVARELGFFGPLPALCLPENGVLFGCRKIEELQRKHKNELDLIASYNAGSPRKSDDGKYVNQDYVDKVSMRLKSLRRLKGR